MKQRPNESYDAFVDRVLNEGPTLFVVQIPDDDDVLEVMFDLDYRGVYITAYKGHKVIYGAFSPRKAAEAGDYLRMRGVEPRRLVRGWRERHSS